MVVERGEVWWADLPRPEGSEPGYGRPVVVVQSDSFNRSCIQTVIVIALTTNLRLEAAPGNFPLSADESGLPRDSVVNVSQMVTLDKSFLKERVSRLEAHLVLRLEEGLREVLAL